MAKYIVSLEVCSVEMRFEIDAEDMPTAPVLGDLVDRQLIEVAEYLSSEKYIIVRVEPKEEPDNSVNVIGLSPRVQKRRPGNNLVQ